MTYNERVQDIAEKMAKDYRIQYWDKAVQDFPALISSLIPAARIAVAHMADAYEWGHHDGWMSKAMNFNRLDSPSLKEGLIKSGLIPDDGQGLPKQIDYIPAATLREGGIDDMTNNEALK